MNARRSNALRFTKVATRLSRHFLAILCATSLVPAGSLSRLQMMPARAYAEDQAPRIPSDQLDSLVAPIALYPDPLLGQVLVASTYPLEIIQLQQWLERNKGLKDKALVDAVSKQPWDPSIQAMAALPAVVKRLADDIQWTTDLGNAFLAQEGDVMEAVQRMRRKAQDMGTLHSTEQQKVETKVVENKSVIVVEQANPQVVYVPSYNPVVVYGQPAYPYPPISYPPPGYYAAGMAITFGLGVAMGAAWGGGWGYNCGWGGGNNNVTVNNNNTFNRNEISRNGNRGAGNGAWQHNPQHRGGAPYGDRGTASRYGGNARGDSLSNRQASARQQVARQGGTPPSSNRAGAGGPGGAAARAQGSRGAGASAQAMSGSRGAGASAQAMGGSRGAAGANSAASRSAASRSASGSARAGGRSDGFGGGPGGYSGSSARATSSRGASSMGAAGRGGGSYGGGGRGGGGGGGRGGGGGGRGGGRR